MKKNGLKILMLCLAIICILLGNWQLKRLKWKREIINLIETYNTPVSFDGPMVNIGELLYHPIKLQGNLHNDQEIHLYANYRSKKGYLIITPFELSNGETILLNRGWVPAEFKLAQTRPQTLLQGQIEIEGRVFDIKKPRWIFFQNDTQRNLWLWLDIDSIKQYTNLDLPSFYVIQQNQIGKDNLPVIEKFTAKKIKNDHLGYAVTWYSLAIVASLYILFFFKS